MAALKERTRGTVRFAGIGGEEMAAQGLEMPRGRSTSWPIMGVAEVLPARARASSATSRETVADVMRAAPRCGRDDRQLGLYLARRAGVAPARRERVPLIHYVAPMVWAWRAGRARRMARWYDHLMVLLPFEPPYFAAVGLSCAYVGHPVIESGADRGDGPAFRRRHGIAAEATLVILLPGSRRGEVRRLLPVFKDAVRLLAERYPGLRVALPTTATVSALVKAEVADWPVPVIVVERGEKYDAFAAGTVALAASGTVALELALAGLPAVIAYRINRLTHALVKRVVKIRYSHLLNLVLGREAVPELLQDKCTGPRLAAEASLLIGDDAARAQQLAACREGLAALGLGALSPGMRAADEVLAIIAARAPRS